MFILKLFIIGMLLVALPFAVIKVTPVSVYIDCRNSTSLRDCVNDSGRDGGSSGGGGVGGGVVIPFHNENETRIDNVIFYTLLYVSEIVILLFMFFLGYWAGHKKSEK